MYRSKHEAYSFLSDRPEDLRCDFEILTDEIAGYIGLLRAFVDDEVLREQLLFVCELVYHINPSLRTKVTITADEAARLERMTTELAEEAKGHLKQFVLPVGCRSAGFAHVLRSKGKALVRLLYRHAHQGHHVDEILFDVSNLLSGYFFLLAVKLNRMEGVTEIPFVSRNYKVEVTE